VRIFRSPREARATALARDVAAKTVKAAMRCSCIVCCWPHEVSRYSVGVLKRAMQCIDVFIATSTSIYTTRYINVLQTYNVLHKRAGQPKRAGHLTELG
jgi:hypothetical protein